MVEDDGTTLETSSKNGDNINWHSHLFLRQEFDHIRPLIYILSSGPSSRFKMLFDISIHRMSSVNCFIFFMWIFALDLH